jgi:hypothetical protein
MKRVHSAAERVLSLIAAMIFVLALVDVFMVMATAHALRVTESAISEIETWKIAESRSSDCWQ